MKCPPDWRPWCSCSPVGAEPSPRCYVHGYPPDDRCPYCRAFLSAEGPCKRCGYTRPTGGAS